MRFSLVLFLIVPSLFAEPIIDLVVIKSKFVPSLPGDASVELAHPRNYVKIICTNPDNYPYNGYVSLKISSQEKPIKIPVFTWPNTTEAQVSYVDLGSIWITDKDLKNPQWEITWEKRK